jgi:ABC-type transport system involved in multi-copper enzyme maturation permease subunit
MAAVPISRIDQSASVPWLRSALIVLIVTLGAAVLRGPPFAWIGFVGGPLLLVGVLLRQAGRLGLSLAYCDVVRLARRGRGTLLRMLYTLLLLTVLYFVYRSHMSWRLSASSRNVIAGTNALARLAESFVYAVLAAQMLAVVLLAPVCVAGAIAEEKERKTLDLLFTTGLGDHEIVVGKLLGRLTHILGILLAGVPVLSLTQFFGGVDMGVILCACVLTALILFSAGSLSMLVSTIVPSVWGAVVTTYVLLFVSCVCLVNPATSPLQLLNDLFQFGVVSEALAGYALTHACLGLACLLLAVKCLRVEPRTWIGCADRLADARITGAALAGAVCDQGQSTPAAPVAAELAARSGRFDDLALDIPLLRRLPGLDSEDNALLWKEKFFPGRGAAFALGQLLAPIAVACVPVFLLLSIMSGNVTTGAHQLAMLGLFGSACFLCFGLAFRSANCVVAERQQATLDGLLTLPVERSEILRAKWRATFARLQAPIIVLSASWLLLLVTGLPVPAGLLLAAHLAAVAIFLSNFGMYLSCAARTRLWANGLMAVVIVLILSPNILMDRVPIDPAGWSGFLHTGINPVSAWISVTVESLRLPQRAPPHDAQPVLEGAAFYLFLALWSWRAARRRFQRDPLALGK